MTGRQIGMLVILAVLLFLVVSVTLVFALDFLDGSLIFDLPIGPSTRTVDEAEGTPSPVAPGYETSLPALDTPSSPGTETALANSTVQTSTPATQTATPGQPLTPPADICALLDLRFLSATSNIAAWRLQNDSGVALTITRIEIDWPKSNDAIFNAFLDGKVIWSDEDLTPPTTMTTWIGNHEDRNVDRLSRVEFFFGTRWYPVSEPPTFGIMPFFVATLWVTLVATAISVPVGVACAAYLAEVAPAKVRETVKPVIEILAGIPSVVMGFIGLMLLSPLVQSAFNLNTGLSGLTAGIMLSLMSLPIIISVSEDALRAVPDDFRQAAYALGATRWETIRHVSIPGALSGITAAIMLGVGRAIGETMTVLMVAGGALAVPVSSTEPMMPMTAAIASGIGNAVRGGLQYQALFAIGLILFVITLAVNLIADRVLERQKRKFVR